MKDRDRKTLNNLGAGLQKAIHSDINHSKGRHACPVLQRGKLQQESRKKLDSPYQVRGRLSRARNDKPYKTYVVMYK